jgi:hydroxylamine reductase
VSEGTQAGPGILITGHDLVDLADLLRQCEGTDVKVYTHGEMLPAHMYPNRRNHPNLAGHFGGAWQKQRSEFADFSGPVLATTNCIVIPPQSYAGRLFTTRVTAAPGGQRLTSNDFSAVIAKAKECAPLQASQIKKSTVGFHHSAILALAPTIVEAVKAGKISRFFVIGGCDGAEPGRNYFADYAKLTPADSFIPGDTPIHEARFAALVNAVMSPPVSAMMCLAAASASSTLKQAIPFGIGTAKR